MVHRMVGLISFSSGAMNISSCYHSLQENVIDEAVRKMSLFRVVGLFDGVPRKSEMVALIRTQPLYYMGTFCLLGTGLMKPAYASF
jgi:hypothetical protein